MHECGTFPFGEPLQPLVQKDRSEKKVFVLGVYASAVHARWFDERGKLLVRALAVASEPVIFWDGTGVESILGRIKLPDGAGRLEAADPSMNGPSGRALDDHFLEPLGVPRSRAWLCDLVPHTCLNPSQKKALDREYVPRAKKFGLPAVSLPAVPKTFADDKRREEVLREVEESRAELVVLLGDEPIRHWLSKFDARRKTLAEFGDSDDSYGRRHQTTIAGRQYEVLPLAHPRQVAALGSHSPKWRSRHEAWERRQKDGREA